MRQHIFAVYDSKAQVFLAPFFVPAVGVALRAFATAVRDETTQMSQFPEDFTLFEIGEFDDSRGLIEPLVQHKNHGLAAQFKTEADHVR